MPTTSPASDLQAPPDTDRPAASPLALLELTAPADAGHLCGRPLATNDPWTLVYEEADASLEGTREALCTLGNGFWATRGSALGVVADGTHYPGTYLAGCTTDSPPTLRDGGLTTNTSSTHRIGLR